ncbi:MAG: PLDc N-terminal domain-containing protein [Labedaea sp.]
MSEPWTTILIGAVAVVAILWIAVLVTVIRGVVRSQQDTGMKVVWVAFIMTSQPLGVLLWLLVGRRRVAA